MGNRPRLGGSGAGSSRRLYGNSARSRKNVVRGTWHVNSHYGITYHVPRNILMRNTIMTSQALSPQETHSLLTNNVEAVYIDVRTVAEFATGHPRGKVVNIPILFRHPTKEDTYPNQSFLAVV